MSRSRLYAALNLAFLRMMLRDRKVRVGLLLSPVIAIAFIAFYKATVFRDLSFAQGVATTMTKVVVADPGRPLPGLAIDATEAVARLSRNPSFVTRALPTAEAEKALADNTADLLVLPAADGRNLLVRGSVDRLRTADLVREMLLFTGPAAAATASDGGLRIEIVAAPAGTRTGIVRFAAFYVVLGIASLCFTTGAVNYVAEIRKGKLRGLLVTPSPRLAVLVAHASAVCLIAVAQATLVLGGLLLMDEGGRASIPGFIVAAAVTAAMLTALAYALLSFKPVDDERGAMPLLMVVVMLASVQFGYSSAEAAKPSDSGDLMTLLNPFGPVIELIDVALTGRISTQPLELSLAMAVAWTLLGVAVAWARTRFSLEPDWTTR